MDSIDPEPKHEELRILPKTALFLAAISIVAADGEIVNAETADLEKIVRGDQETFALAYSIFRNKSYKECVDLVSDSLNEKQKNTLIAILLDLVMADGKLANAEEQLISVYVSKFETPVDVFKNLCHYISMKNNFSLFDKNDKECLT